MYFRNLFHVLPEFIYRIAGTYLSYFSNLFHVFHLFQNLSIVLLELIYLINKIISYFVPKLNDIL